jgi:hypothetical protein
VVTSHFSISNLLSIFLLVNGDPLLWGAVTVIVNALHNPNLERAFIPNAGQKKRALKTIV